MNNDKILSICMMVKDEEKNLRRCLESLKQLIVMSDVELIIVDTGSSDSTVKIAQEYTDKIFFHKWSNDFSGMRNITISYAKGEYVLILDADEVLADAGLLYEYLNDPRLEAYNTFLLKIKNLDSSGSFTVIAQERVFKNDGDFRYEGSVHNQPVYKAPVVNAEIYIEHYGYMFEDKELRERKFKRTSAILLEELKKDPSNLYYRFQLARSYSAHHDEKEALDEIRRAYGLLPADPEKKKLYVYVYGTYSIICIENREFEEAVRICQEGSKLRADYLDLYYIMATAYLKLGKKDRALRAYEIYTDLVMRYESLAISGDRAIELYYTGNGFRDNALDFIINELFGLGRYQDALGHIEKTSDEKVRAVLQSKALLKLEKFEELRDVFIKYQQQKIVHDSIIRNIEAEKINFNADKKRRIEIVFSAGDDIYSLLNRIRNSGGSDASGLAEKIVGQTDFSELADYYADMFMPLVGENFKKVTSAFKRINKTKIKQYIKRIIENKKDLTNIFESYLLGEQIREDDYQSQRVFISIAYTLLFIKAGEWRNKKCDPTDQYYNIFKLYLANGFKYISLLYTRERLRLYYSTIEDQEDRFFIALRYAGEAAGRKDIRSGVRYFREAAASNPYLACYLKMYKNELFEENSGEVGEVTEE